MAKGGKQMNIGEKIIEIRKERKMTQEDFANISCNKADSFKLGT